VSRRVRIVVLVVAGALVLGGCRVRAVVSVRVDGDGSGTVTVRVELDRDALRRLTGTADDLDDAVRLDGLQAAGWTIEPWEIDSRGGAALVLRAPFAGEAELVARLESLAGDGAEIDVELRRSRGVLRSRDRLEVALDTRRLGAGLASDPGVADALRAAGLPVDATDAALEAELRRSLRITLRLRVPGDRGRAELSPGDEVRVVASSSDIDYGRVVTLVVALAFGVLGLRLVVLAAASARDRATIRSRG
jgi:hypothetical protein